MGGWNGGGRGWRGKSIEREEQVEEEHVDGRARRAIRIEGKNGDGYPGLWIYIVYSWPFGQFYSA